ncbi:unnamed protein product [Protopolystoma xenopodis]|uniref:Uncharacterized protein n=1 Tax=Protopolystoma xenopodis TaxID=117903 RepID=A0A3S4ZZ32_9PLAT|nr:unnamed protein product [Protopolystoma xenopodis]
MHVPTEGTAVFLQTYETDVTVMQLMQPVKRDDHISSATTFRVVPNQYDLILRYYFHS